MKKFAKKNNKGFSLVELIVVVLIMAIIAVALAPQVMKWVNNARIATDTQTADSIKGNISITLTNSAAYTAVGAEEIVITVSKSSDATITIKGVAPADTDAFAKEFYSVCGSKKEFQAVRSKSVDNFTVKYKNGEFTMPTFEALK